MTDNEQTKIFAQNLSHYVNASGKMQKDIAKELGYPLQTFNGWCKGVSFPSMDKVQKIADYFHIGKTDLINNQNNDTYSFSFSDEEQLVIECYRNLDNSQKEMVKRLVAYYEKIKELYDDKDVHKP